MIKIEGERAKSEKQEIQVEGDELEETHTIDVISHIQTEQEDGNLFAEIPDSI